jgi:hypothetical protein
VHYDDPDAIPLSLPFQGGRAARFRVDEFAIGFLGALAADLGRLPAMKHARGLLDGDSLDVYVEKRLHLEVFDAVRALWRRRLARQRGWPWAKPVECPRDLVELIGAHWPDPEVRLVPAPRPRALWRHLRATARHVRDGVWTALCPRLPATPGSRPRIAFEVAEASEATSDPPADRRHAAFKHDAFWLASDLITPGDTVAVLEGKNRYLDLGGQVTTLRGWGVRIVALHPSVRPDGRGPVWRPRTRGNLPTQMVAGFGRAESGAERWLHRVLRDCARETAYWEAFAREFGIVAFQQTREDLADGIAKRLAMHRVGGIEFSKMRSEIFDDAAPAFHVGHSVFFSWHARASTALEVSRSRCEEVVVTGYPYGHALPAAAGVARRLREHVTRAGADLVVAVYDNSPHAISHLGLDAVVAFYEVVLGWASRHRRVALLVKSKKPQIVAGLPAPVRSHLRALTAAGRCEVLSGHTSLVAPSALAADLALAVPLSTAACEAALSGCPRVIVFDPCGTHNHPWAHLGEGRVVFRDLVDFGRVLDEWARDPRGVGWGDVGPLRGTLDPFGDGRAYARAGQYLASFVDARARGLDRKAALAAARDASRTASNSQA